MCKGGGGGMQLNATLGTGPDRKGSRNNAAKTTKLPTASSTASAAAAGGGGGGGIIVGVWTVKRCRNLIKIYRLGDPQITKSSIQALPTEYTTTWCGFYGWI